MEPITDEVIDFVGIGFVIMMPTLRVFAAGACSQNGIVLNSLKYVLYKMMADVGCIKADSADIFFEVSLPADFQVNPPPHSKIDEQF